MALTLALGAGLPLAGCRGAPAASEADEALAERLIARWRGVAVDAPAGAWWKDTSWDVVLGLDGDFSAIAATAVDGARKELRFQGRFEVEDGALRVRDDPNLEGLWRLELVEAPLAPGVERLPAEHGQPATLRLERVGASREDTEREPRRIKLALDRRYGS